MKKRTIKNLALHKKTISRLDQTESIKGGITKTWFSWIFTDCLKEPEPLPASDAEICSGRYGNCPINI